jgi:uncharacterized protein (DUF983 family)
MSIQSLEQAPTRALSPLVRGRRMHCPRCTAGLLVEGTDLFCVLCGYAYALDDLDGWRRRPDVAPARAA